MTDKKKLELIDEMIGNYYEFCTFDDEGMNAGALQMLIGCIEAVVFTENKQEEEESTAFIPAVFVIPDDDEDCCDDCGGWKMTCACSKEDDDCLTPDECESCAFRDECLQEELDESIENVKAIMKEYLRRHGEDI